MFGLKNNRKHQAFLLITLGVVITFFSYQNFQYPQTIEKSSVDLSTGLYSSDVEIQKTRQRLNSQVPNRSRLGSEAPVSSKSNKVTESKEAMKLTLKRAPATKKKKIAKKISKNPEKKKSKKGLKKPKKKTAKEKTKPQSAR